MPRRMIIITSKVLVVLFGQIRSIIVSSGPSGLEVKSSSYEVA